MAKTILLADDSLTIQKVVELTFMDQDYQVFAVGDGQSALNRWAESRPDVVIADVHMPGADGYEVCRQVKASRPGTPVLLLVGTFETFDDAQARACGANGHLKKPFDSQELFRLVERLIAENARQAPAPPVMAAAPVDPFAAAPAFAMPSPPAFAPVQPAAAQPLPSPAFLPPVASVPAPAPPALVSAPPVAAPAAPEFAFSLSPVAASPAEPTRVAAPAVPAPVEAPSAPLPNVDTRPTAARQVESVPADAGGGLTDADIDRIARRVAELIGEKAVKEIAWEVVPDLAEVVIRERIRELESQVQ